MTRIERIQPSLHKKDRVLVYLTGGRLLRITPEELLRFDLRPGMDLAEDVLEELRRVRLEPKRLRFVHHTAAAPPSLFLLEARLGGGVGLTVEPPLLLHGPDGGETEDVRRAYFRDKEE